MINLMYCGNEKMFDGILISLLSIEKYTKEALNVYLMTMDLQEIKKDFKPITEVEREIIERILQDKNSKNVVHLIDTSELYRKEFAKNSNKNTHFTPYIFIRIMSDEIKELPDKLLYLDADIIAYDDIKQIFDTDMTNYEIGASLDAIGRKAISPNYMNSGVILMNLPEIRETGCFKEARRLCRTKKMMLPDQTAINKACTKKIYFPDKYNEQAKKQSDTVLRHFSMTFRAKPYPTYINAKPWQIDEIHKKYNIYDFDDIYDEYENYLKKFKKEIEVYEKE